jgi:hypothetical protein
MLTLSKAIKEKRLQEFIAQQESANVGPADAEKFEKVIDAAVKPHRLSGQTSGSRGRGGSGGK